MKTTLVTVTYGTRWHLLNQVLKAGFDEGVNHAIIVDNGSQQDIATLATEAFGEVVTTVTLEKNTGSAYGFKVGLQQALADNAEFILLLDDDNLLLPGNLNKLKNGYFNELKYQSVTQNTLALLAYRPDHQADLALGAPVSRLTPKTGSYFGFHVLDIPFKIWRRTLWGKQKMMTSSLPKRVLLKTAPWGGLFLHRSLVEKLGLPNDNFVLYGDDTEYTYRISLADGLIVLYTDSKIEDLEKSWAIKKRFSNQFDALLNGQDDFRAYYGVRNQSYLEEYIFCKNIYRSINRWVFLLLLKIRAYQLNKTNRLKLIFHAIADGESGKLGIHPDFPL